MTILTECQMNTGQMDSCLAKLSWQVSSTDLRLTLLFSPLVFLFILIVFIFRLNQFIDCGALFECCTSVSSRCGAAKQLRSTPARSASISDTSCSRKLWHDAKLETSTPGLSEGEYRRTWTSLTPLIRKRRRKKSVIYIRRPSRVRSDSAGTFSIKLLMTNQVMCPLVTCFSKLVCWLPRVICLYHFLTRVYV